MSRRVYCGLCRLICRWGRIHMYLKKKGYPLRPWNRCPYGVKGAMSRKEAREKPFGRNGLISTKKLIACVIIITAIIAFAFVSNYPLYETLSPEKYKFRWENFTKNDLIYYNVGVVGLYRDNLAHVNVLLSCQREDDSWSGYLTLNIWHSDNTAIENIKLSIGGYRGGVNEFHWEVASQLKCSIETIRELEGYSISFKDLGIYGTGSFTQHFRISFKDWPIMINVEVDLVKGLKRMHLKYSQSLSPQR